MNNFWHDPAVELPELGRKVIIVGKYGGMMKVGTRCRKAYTEEPLPVFHVPGDRRSPYLAKNIRAWAYVPELD